MEDHIKPKEQFSKIIFLIQITKEICQRIKSIKETKVKDVKLYILAMVIKDAWIIWANNQWENIGLAKSSVLYLV